jgi:hypothetical protein
VSDTSTPAKTAESDTSQAEGPLRPTLLGTVPDQLKSRSRTGLEGRAGSPWEPYPELKALEYLATDEGRRNRRGS